MFINSIPTTAYIELFGCPGLAPASVNNCTNKCCVNKGQGRAHINFGENFSNSCKLDGVGPLVADPPPPPLPLIFIHTPLHMVNLWSTSVLVT